MKRLAHIAFFIAGLLLAPALQAQVPQDSAGVSPDGIPWVEGDSAAADSAAKAIKPHTELISIENVWAGLDFRQPIRLSLASVQLFDPAEREGSYTQSLGAIGKPYRRYRFGMEASFFEPAGFLNPISGHEEAYVSDALHDVRYYNSHTPLVNVNYLQGRRKLAQLQTKVSQNITPFLNAAIWYERRQNENSYLEMVTDHSYLGASVHGQSKSDRYHLFANVVYNHLQDELNGGQAQVLLFEGVPQVIIVDSSFLKLQQPVALKDAVYDRRYQSIFFSQAYRLFDDTLRTPLRFTLFHSLQRDEFENQYIDSAYAPSGLEPNPVYRNVALDTVTFTADITEVATFKRWRYMEGVSMSYADGPFHLQQMLQVTNEFNTFRKVESDRFRQDKLAARYTGAASLRSKPSLLRADWALGLASNNFFKEEKEAAFHGSLSLPREVTDFVLRGARWLKPTDSLDLPVTHWPATLHAWYQFREYNPSFQQSFYQGLDDNLYQGVRGLMNPQMSHFRTGIQFQKSDTLDGENIRPGNRFYLGWYRTRLDHAIYHDDSMQVRQFPVGRFVSWKGLELDWKFRSKRFFMEHQLSTQFYHSNARGDLLQVFRVYVPRVYGRSSFYYENTRIKIASVLRFGVDIHFFGGHRPWLFDPVSQQWYFKSGVKIASYGRVDVHAATQIKRAYLFLRVTNVLEEVFRPGYFTTYYYPMQERMFLFGVNWTFFD